MLHAIIARLCTTRLLILAQILQAALAERQAALEAVQQEAEAARQLAAAAQQQLQEQQAQLQARQVPPAPLQSSAVPHVHMLPSLDSR